MTNPATPERALAAVPPTSDDKALTRLREIETLAEGGQTTPTLTTEWQSIRSQLEAGTSSAAREYQLDQATEAATTERNLTRFLKSAKKREANGCRIRIIETTPLRPVETTTKTPRSHLAPKPRPSHLLTAADEHSSHLLPRRPSTSHLTS